MKNKKGDGLRKEKPKTENEPDLESNPTVGDYKILPPHLGKGAFGVVWKAIHLRKGNTVAIKELSVDKGSEESLKNLKMEIKLLQSLAHPNIVRYIDQCNPKAGKIFIVMEYMENGSLAKMLKEHGRFPESLCKVFMSQVLRGLSYLHDQGVIHRDIKGGNILITTDGVVKLADFGVSIETKSIAETEEASGTGEEEIMPAGTPYYMAPEVIQFMGAKPQSDIWSVGCTVIELLTKFPPYYNLDPFSAMYRMVQDEHPPLPPVISDALEEFLLVCFRRDVQFRASAEDLLKHRWLKETMETAEPKENFDVATRNIIKRHNEALDEGQDKIKKFGYIDTLTPQALKSISEVNETLTLNSLKLNAKQLSQLKALPKPQKFEEQEKQKDNKPKKREKPKQRPKSKKPKTPKASKMKGKKEPVNLDLDVSGIVLPGLDGGKRAKGSHLIRAQANLNKFKEVDDDDDDFDLDFAPLPAVKKPVQPVKLENNVLNRFKENVESLDDFDSFDADFEKVDLANVLNQKKNEKWEDDLDELEGSDDAPPDEKAIIQEIFQDEIITAVENQFDKLYPAQTEEEVEKACQQLMDIFQHHPVILLKFIPKHSLLPLMLMLDVKSPKTVSWVLKLMGQMMTVDKSVLTHLCIMGLIPFLTSWAASNHSMSVRLQAANLIKFVITSNDLTLQMFIACRGLAVLVDLLNSEDESLTSISVECISFVIKQIQSAVHKDEIHRLFVFDGVAIRLAKLLCLKVTHPEPTKISKEHIPMIAEILNQFSTSDLRVQKTLCAETINALKPTMDAIQPDSEASLSILKMIRNLANSDQQLRSSVELFIERLVLFGSYFVQRNQFTKDINYYNQLIHCIVLLCQSSRAREKAILAGVVPFLQFVINSGNDPLKACATPFLCEIGKFAISSPTTWEIVWNNNVLNTYLKLLADVTYCEDVFTAIEFWVKNKSSPELEKTLLQNSEKICSAIESTSGDILLHLMESTLTMISVANEIKLAFRDVSRTKFLALVAKLLKRKPAEQSSVLIAILKVLRGLQCSLRTYNLEQLIQNIAHHEKSVIARQLAQELLTASRVTKAPTKTKQ